MAKVVPRRDLRGLTERRIIEIDPRGLRLTVLEGHRRLESRVQAMLRIARPISLDGIEARQHEVRLIGFEELTPDAALARHGRRIDPQVEEDRFDRTTTHIPQLRIDAYSKAPVEPCHQG